MESFGWAIFWTVLICLVEPDAVIAIIKAIKK
jgi:hypothetical protein